MYTPWRSSYPRCGPQTGSTGNPAQKGANVKRLTGSDDAHTPEELESLLEDALVMRDAALLSGMYEPGAILMTAHSEPVTGPEACAQRALGLWQGDRSYVADPRLVMQARDLALVVSNDCVSVVRRDRTGCWRYAIVLQGPDQAKE